MWMKIGGGEQAEMWMGEKSYFYLLQGFFKAWVDTENTPEKRDSKQDVQIFKNI